MLVLTRKRGERIILGEDIVLTVVRIGPDSVKIGIDAPKNINIAREELVIATGPDARDSLPTGRLSVTNCSACGGTHALLMFHAGRALCPTRQQTIHAVFEEPTR